METKEFEQRLNDINAAGYIAAALGLGHELGLFDLIIAKNSPMTSHEIAEAGDMKERYVREWLGCMTAAQIVILDPDTGHYSIPEKHHAAIKGATPWSPGISAISIRKEDVKECFKKKGPYGIDFDHDDEFWTWFGAFRTRTAGGLVKDGFLPQFETEGIVANLEKGIKVLDVGCGSAPFSIEYGTRFPNSTFTGLDCSDKALEAARRNTSLSGLSNISFMKGDLFCLPESLKEQYDLVILIDCLHDLPDPEKALCEIKQVLKPNGFLSIVDLRPHSKQSDNVGDLTAAMFYTCSTFFCLPSSMGAGPRVGYGACWGHEKMKKTIEKHFKINSEVNLPMLHVHFVCSKK